MSKSKKLLNAMFGLLSVLLLPASAFAVAVGSPRLYLAQPTVTAAANSNVSLPVHIAANGTKLDTVNVVVTFPADKLTFVSLDKSGSYFDTVIPAVPKAANGKVEFSAASLTKGGTTDDVLIGSLVFSAKASTGVAAVDLSGSQAASDGKLIDVTSTGSTVNLTAAGSPVSGVNITNVSVSNVTISSGIVHWHTDVAAGSTVDYGNNTHYGFTAGSTDQVTDHTVQLGAFFGGSSTVHFKVTSVASDGQNQTSNDQTFKTLGYNVAVKIVDTAGKLVPGAKVSMAGGTEVKTDANGVAMLHNVAPGNQKVVIDGGRAQFIAVKTHSGNAATVTQQFTLTARSDGASLYIILLLLAATAVVIFLLWRERAKLNDKP